MTPMIMPGPDASDKDWRVFLERQLAGAVALLRAREETEAQVVHRYDARYKTHEAQMVRIDEARKKAIADLERQYGAYAARYSLLRQHNVQVWGLGIATSGENLDRALDEQIERSIATSP